jgi:energy-coupling factor transport system ATP-binding protein
VLALKPKILVLDESTAMLDPKGRKEVMQVVKKLNKEQKVTVITITHYMDEVVDADRVLVINDGEIALSGTPKEIFAKKDLIKSFGLELPVAAVIAQKLKDCGINLSNDILTEEDLARELCALK